jgi:glutaconate CoA-transferase, subunit B
MAAVIARAVRDGEAVGIGVNSPVPTLGVLLARATHAPSLRLRSPGLGGAVAFIGSKEFFDFAQRGKLDLFFLSGVQIDAFGRLNMHVLGEYERPERRFAGAFGSAVLYPIVPRVILFRMEHSPRVLVERVDFVTAAGRPELLVTPKAVLVPNPETGRLELASYHPGELVESVRAATGFELAVRGDVHETAPPGERELALLRGPVLAEVAAAYPAFAAALRA